jgi:hypothetical protein
LKSQSEDTRLQREIVMSLFFAVSSSKAIEKMAPYAASTVRKSDDLKYVGITAGLISSLIS